VHETLQALRSNYPQGQLIAVLELRSNTMKRGSHRDALGQALAMADVAVVRRRADLDWDPAQLALDPDRTTLMVCDTLTQIVDIISDKAKPGDQVVMMSNGSFDDLKEILQARLS
jgi:UDP-N-acetylmuramate: L-alanyl-gamma-D-glutamyl-meso-diaminopimelate ligase